MRRNGMPNAKTAALRTLILVKQPLLYRLVYIFRFSIS